MKTFCGTDIIEIERIKESIENMVMRTIQNGDALLLGKFLVPAVLEFLGAQIEDILPLKVLLPKLDEKHKYQALIFNAYIQNNAFVLSDEQRLDAYHQYLLPRQTKKTK